MGVRTSRIQGASHAGSFIIATTLLLATVVPCHAVTPVRVGMASNVDHIELEVHEATGNLFAVERYTIRWGLDPPDTFGWALLISTDNGDSWAQTFSSTPRPDPSEYISATIVHDYLYIVSQEAGAASGLVDIQRFAVADGAADSAFGVFTVIDVGVGQLKDLVLSGNTDASDGALYLLLIDRDGNLRFFVAWDYSFADGATAEDFSEIPTGVTSADWRLDVAFNVGDSPYSLFASYIDNSHKLCVWRMSQTANNVLVLTPEASSNSSIRIAADQDAVIIVYLRDDLSNSDIRYHRTQDAGATWSWGTLAEDIGDGVTYTAPTATARWGRGIMSVHHKMGTGGAALYSTRRPVEEDHWTTPSLTFDTGIRTGARTDVQPLVDGSWGVLFISDAGDPQAVWFMQLPMIFADGFASEDVLLWSASAGS